MNFANGHILWLLLVIPPGLLVFLWWAGRKKQALLAQFIERRLLGDLLTGVSATRRKIRWACLVAAAALLIVTMARPQWGFTWEETRQRGLDIVVAIDTSKSMLAEDIAPNRLARAKLAALDLMQQAKSDRLVLVAFAGGAFLQCPLTIDDAAFRQCLDTLDVNIIPQGGTAVAEAIQTATTAFKRDNDNYKVLVLFTDGEDNDEGTVEAATKAEKAGLKIFTVGIGTAEGELLRLKDEKGRTDYVRDEQGNVVKSHLNEGLLQQIAGAAGGFYLPLRGAKTIDTLYEKGLGPLPKSESKERLVKRYHERFYWPLALAMLLLLVEMFFPERRRTNGAISNIQRSTLNAQSAAAALLFAWLLLPATVNASPSSGLKDYRAGRYAEAQKEFERLAQEDKKGDLRLAFNAGVAAYRATNYDAAVRHFKTTLVARDLKLQAAAYFNLGNTRFRLGEAAKDLDALQESWESAIKSYQNAVVLDKKDADAAFNLAFVKNAVEQIKLLREVALRARAAADQEVKRRNYHHAREIMERLLQQNIAPKPFEEFAKKLKDIDEIATPPQP